MRIGFVLLLTATIAVAIAATTGGCRKASASAESSRSQTPKDALLRLLRAMKEANPDKVAAACKITNPQEVRPVIEASSTYTKEVYRFRDALIATYGPEAWERFQDPRHRPGDHDTTFVLVTDEVLENAAKTEFEIDGNRATCEMPMGSAKQRHKIRLLKNPDGTWIVDGSMFIPPDQTAQEMIKVLTSLTELVKKYETAIGKPNITASDIDYELARSVDAMVRPDEVDSSKHRFEVDKL